MRSASAKSAPKDYVGNALVISKLLWHVVESMKSKLKESLKLNFAQALPVRCCR